MPVPTTPVPDNATQSIPPISDAEREHLGSILGVWDWDPATDTTRCSGGIAAAIGQPGAADAMVAFYRTVDKVHPDDVPAVRDAMRPVLRGEREQFVVSYRFRAAGGWRWYVAQGHVAERGPGGRAMNLRGVVVDFTERQRFRQANSELRARFRDLVESLVDWYWDIDADYRYRVLSGMPRTRPEIDPRAFIGRRWDETGNLPVDMDRDGFVALLDRQAPFRDILFRRARTDGTTLYSMVCGEPLFDASGTFNGYHGVIRDVSAEKSAELALKRSEARFRDLVELSSDWYWELDADLRYRIVKGVEREHFGVPPEAFLGRHPWDMGAQPVEQSWDDIRRMLEAHLAAKDVLFKRSLPDGTTRFQLTNGRPIFDEDGGFVGYHGTVRDITALKSAEQALALSEQRFRDFARASGDWMSETDAEGRYTWVSDLIAAKRGVPAEWYLGRRRIDIASRDSDLAQEPWKSHLEALARREPFRDFRYVSEDAGGRAVISVSGVPVFDMHGTFLGYRNSGADITEQAAIEERARHALDLLRAAMEKLDQGVVLCDAGDRIVFCNARFRIDNASVGDRLLPGTLYEDFMRAAIDVGRIPDAVGREDQWLAERTARRRRGPNRFERRRNDGGWYLISDTPLPDGGVITFTLDITAQKDAQAVRDTEARAQRGALVREVHHRIKNNLQGMAGLLGLRAAAQPGTAPALQEAIRQIQAIAKVHGMYGQGGDRISLAALVGDIVAATNGLRGIQASVDPQAVGGDWLVDEQDAVPVALVVNELVWNAIKHTDPAVPDPVRVALLATAVEGARLEVRNRGRLDVAGKDAVRSGVGLGLMRTLLPEHAGAIELSQHGEHVLAVLELRSPAVRRQAATPPEPADV